MKEQDYSDPITDEWCVGDVLQRYPSTSVSSCSMVRRAGYNAVGSLPIIPDESARIC